MFCVECGKETNIFRDGVCKECYLKNHSFTKGPEIIDIPMCVHCESYKYKNTWASELFNDVLKKFIKNNYTISKELKKIDINSSCKEQKNGLECKIYISGFIDDVEITEEHDLFVRLNKIVCDVCSRRAGGYHEAIIQIRADKRKLSKEELSNMRITVESLVETMRSKGNRGLFITDYGEEHGGFDFYISDKTSALAITKKLQEKYGGEIKQSSKNIGMKDSKQLYRSTYLLRIPIFQKHDFINKDDSYYYISSINMNKVHAINLSTWSDEIFDIKDLKKINIIGNKELIKEMIIVSQTSGDVQLMNSKNYEIKVIKKPKKVSFDTEKIKIVELDDKLFLLP